MTRTHLNIARQGGRLKLILIGASFMSLIVVAGIDRNVDSTMHVNPTRTSQMVRSLPSFRSLKQVNGGTSAGVR
jgi:hypothetical protein